MKKILLASTTEEENLILRRKLEPLTGEIGNISYVTTRPQALVYSARDNFELVVINVPEFTNEHRSTVLKLRELGYRGSLIVTAKAKTADQIREINAMQSTVFVEKPYEIKDLLGVVSKILRARSVSQRIFRRYYTMQKAEVEITAEQRKAPTTLYNLSKGGAYIELANTETLKIGDELTLHVPLNEMRRTYQMAARVVWTTIVGAGGGFGVGLEFVGPGDVQKTIIGHLE
jgi:Tfp pilus assembly protein PilZ